MAVMMTIGVHQDPPPVCACMHVGMHACVHACARMPRTRQSAHCHTCHPSKSAGSRSILFCKQDAYSSKSQSTVPDLAQIDLVPRSHSKKLALPSSLQTKMAFLWTAALC